MKLVKVSAPGKLILFGEHAVVYGFPSIVTAINKRLFVTIEESTFKKDLIEAPQVKNFDFILHTIKEFKKRYDINQWLKITTHADFNDKVGLGSSSAVTVALSKGLCEFFSISLTKKQLFDFCYEVVLGVKKVSSGVDLAAAIYGGTIFFSKNGQIIEPLPFNILSIIVGYSGNKADTPSIINKVAQKYALNKDSIKSIFDKIHDITLQAKQSFIEADFKKVGKLMTENHSLLKELGVSTEMLDAMVEEVCKAGAYGAKLSGAGGGDCMIGLIDEEKRADMENVIQSVGGEPISVHPYVEGVKIEL